MDILYGKDIIRKKLNNNAVENDIVTRYHHAWRGEKVGWEAVTHRNSPSS